MIATAGTIRSLSYNHDMVWIISGIADHRGFTLPTPIANRGPTLILLN